MKAVLNKAQAGIKISGRNTNNLRKADDITLMAESDEELNSLLIKVKAESEKARFKLSIQKTKIMESGSITLHQMNRENEEKVAGFIFLGSKMTVNGDYCHEIKDTCSLEGKLC